MVRWRGDAPELQHDEPGHGLIHAFRFVRKGPGPQQVFELIYRHHPIHQPRVVFALDRGELSGLPGLRHLSHDESV
jgi:hypothetical protein